MTQQRTWIAGLAVLVGTACLGIFCLAAAGTAVWLMRPPLTTSGAEVAETLSSTSELTATGQPGTSGLIPTRTPRPALVTPAPPQTPTATSSQPATAGFNTAIPNPAGPTTSPLVQAGSGGITPTLASETATPGTLSGPDAPGLGCLTWNAPAERALVHRVVDGVTLEVDIAGELRQVRYIGATLLDYTSDPTIFVRSTEKNQELASGKNVLLYKDVLDQDPEGHFLRYVITGGRLLNYEIIASGFANAESMPPNTRCDELLLAAERKALAGSLGLWQPTPTVTRTLIPLPSATVATTGNMVVTLISKRGTIWQEPEEFVEIRNDSNGSINLQGWTLQDNERHVFVFPRFILGKGQYCRVYTNEYHSQSCGFSYNSYSPIWDNEGDCAYLKDSLGLLVSTFCYE